MARKKEEDKGDDFFKEIYGKEYTAPSKPSRDITRDKGNLKKGTANAKTEQDQDDESRDPNAIPTDFTSREAKVWEAKAKAVERNWKRKKEEESICRICGDPGHFTQGCPTTLGGGKKSSEISERIPVKDKRLKAKISGTGNSTLENIEKDTGCRLRLEDNATKGKDGFFVCITGTDRVMVRKAIAALKKVVDDDHMHPDFRHPQDPHYTDSDANPFIAASTEHTSLQRMHPKPNLQAFDERADIDQHSLDPTSSHGGSKLQWESGIKTEADSVPSSDLKRGEFALGAGALSSSRNIKGPTEEEIYYGIGAEGRTTENRFKQDLEVGYEHRFSIPRTLEELEHRFVQEMMELTKEQNETEDKENVRHREALREIHERYQHKMAAIRAHQSKSREEFLLREVQSRQQQYHQTANSSTYDYSTSTQLLDLRTRTRDLLGYGSGVDGHHGYDSGYLSYKDREQLFSTAHPYDRNPGHESGGIYPSKQGYDLTRYPPY